MKNILSRLLKDTNKLLLIAEVILLLLIPESVFSQNNSITVDVSKNKILLGRSLYYLKDRTLNIELREAILPENSHLFRPSLTEVVNSGFSSSAYWVRFSLINRTKSDLIRYLEVPFPLIDNVDLYFPESHGSYDLKKAGEIVPASQKEIQYKNPIFVLTLPQGSHTFYLRYQDKGSVPFSLTLWDPVEFTIQSTKEFYIYGTYFFLLFAFLVFNLIIYFTIHEESYLYYIIYIVNMICWQLSYSGYATTLLWPENPWLTNHSIPFFICTTSICAINFARSFLDTASNTPSVDRFFRYYGFCFTFTSVTVLLPDYSFSITLSTVLATSFVLLIFYTAFLCMRKRYHPARYFIIAWFMLIMGTVALGFKCFGLLPSTYFTEYGQYFGSLLEIILLSLALIDRLNIMKQEKELAQSEALSIQRNIKEKLEKQVQVRTKELTLSNQYLESLSNKLSKYLSPQIYDSIFTGKNDAKQQSKRKKLTIFFSDIVGFTDLTDSVEPEEVTGILNLYLNEMSKIALKHGGTIDKFIGDSVMVFFGAPESKGQRQDAIRCLEMAIEMRQKIKTIHYCAETESIHEPLHVRMGINTGYCAVGNFGSENRLEYTIVGRPVNLANRLEARAENNQIIISASTYELVKDHISCTKQGEVKVKGIARKIQTYSVDDVFEIKPPRTHFVEQGSGYSIQVELNKIEENNIEHISKTLKRLLIRMEEKRQLN